METEQGLTVDITPEVSVYATYKRLSYTPWYAIAEFVDNSTQNYFDHKDDLRRVFEKEGTKYLFVDIEYDEESKQLTIVDNANGMDYSELQRAVSLDKPPNNNGGRSEFGMGLKTAACWFGSKWSIETTRLGNREKYYVEVDVNHLVSDKDKFVKVQQSEADPEKHFTKIVLKGLYKPIKGRTSGKIKDLLGSIYREDIRNEEILIKWNTETVSFEEHPILLENNNDESKTSWKKNLDFDVYCDYLEKNLNVHGWVGIRDPGSPKKAGLALLRRGRVILGGPDQNYKPEEIFGQGNTFRSQRLVGELHMDNWPVTQAKDSFDWSGGLEEDFISALRKEIREYITKAENYRSSPKIVTNNDMKIASEETKKVFSNKSFARAIEYEVKFPEPKKTEIQEKQDNQKILAVSKGPEVYKLKISDGEWIFNLHWQDSLSDAHWMSVQYPQDNISEIYLNTSHPFFSKYSKERGYLELIEKFAMSMALAERLSRANSNNGCIGPSDFRNYMNRVLRYESNMVEDNE